MDALTSAQVSALRKALLAWFDRYKRDLPWRRTRDPYAIWVSEIMLQQTRVAAVLEHYARWMARFPTVALLASADEADVLALWSGLGYYRRARYLHAGAKAVMLDYAGVLPRTAAELRRLPGIGEYTSAAIASIAFDEPVAVVDGNVERVIMRLDGLSLEQIAAPNGSGSGEQITPNEARSLESQAKTRALAASPLAREIRVVANQLLVTRRPGDFNQAMMELGATVCLPRGPLCLQCPVFDWCATRGEHVGAPPKAMQNRSSVYTLTERERSGEREILLAQRAADASLMPGMWELPEFAAPLPDAASEALLTLRHSITVTNYTVRIIACTERDALNAAQTASQLWRWIPLKQLPETALTGLARKVLKRLSFWPQPGSFMPRR